jgi:hypothetical protein
MNIAFQGNNEFDFLKFKWIEGYFLSARNSRGISQTLHLLIYCPPTTSPSGLDMRSKIVNNGGFLVGPRYGVHGVGAPFVRIIIVAKQMKRQINWKKVI